MTEEERQRTEAIIRPILRGRDIKRYSYEYANLYLIATVGRLHIKAIWIQKEIEQTYPKNSIVIVVWGNLVFLYNDFLE